jgi:hypothetical protein
MPEKGFPLPGSSYKELIKIIQGYGEVGENAAPADVARIISVHETIVSKNNRFLGAIGVIQGGKKKNVTAIGKELAHALQHEMTDEIVTKWRTIVEANDFLQKVVAAVRIRKGMDESSLESHVAYSAGQPKTAAVATGASTIVAILKAAELLREDGGNLIAITPETVSDLEEMEQLSTWEPQTRRELTSVTGAVHQLVHHRRPVGDGLSINIDVRIQCSPADIDDLGPKLKKLIKDLENEEEPGQSLTPDGEDR